MNRDTLSGIVGSVLLVAAMVGIFVYERTNVQAAAGGDLEPAIAQASLTGTIAVGSSDTKLDNITAVGPTNLTFTLSWTASQGRDTLRLTVTPPVGADGLVATSQAEDDGGILLTVPIPAGSISQGNWTVKVDFTQAEPDALPGGVSPPVGGMADTSVSYEVNVAFA